MFSDIWAITRPLTYKSHLQHIKWHYTQAFPDILYQSVAIYQSNHNHNAAICHISSRCFIFYCTLTWFTEVNGLCFFACLFVLFSLWVLKPQQKARSRNRSIIADDHHRSAGPVKAYFHFVYYLLSVWSTHDRAPPSFFFTPTVVLPLSPSRSRRW